MDQLLLELKKLPRPQPILLGAVIAFLGWSCTPTGK
jgi:hypothetical protein